jgi:hypothetical protein
MNSSDESGKETDRKWEEGEDTKIPAFLTSKRPSTEERKELSQVKK